MATPCMSSTSNFEHSVSGMTPDLQVALYSLNYPKSEPQIAALAYPGSLLEMQKLRPHLYLLNWNLYFNTVSR